MRRLIKKAFEIVNQIGKQFLATDSFTRASALAYTTVISLVPIMMVMIGIMSSFPVFQTYIKMFSGFLFRHFLPSSAVTIQHYIELYANQAHRLSAAGLFFSLIGAVTLLFTMESAFNCIWHVKKRRKDLAAFLIYWAILTLVPLIAATAFAASIYLLSLPYVSTVLKTIYGFAQLLYILPLTLTWICFVVLYKALPNCVVLFRHAAIGALVSAIIFEVLKTCFGYYIAHLTSYEVIYGAIAVIPVFLLWLYLSWLVVLLGAVISYVAGNYAKRKPT